MGPCRTSRPRDGRLPASRGSQPMPHAFKVGQSVALAQTSRDREVYEVAQLMPETTSGEPQYRIKGLSSGTVRSVRGAGMTFTAKSPYAGYRFPSEFIS